jgi:hypothetical protein
VAADTNRKFDHRGDHHDALRILKDLLRNAFVRGIHHFSENVSGGL